MKQLIFLMGAVFTAAAALAQTTLLTDTATPTIKVAAVQAPFAGVPLLSYLQTLGASKGGILSGQTADPYSGTPMDVFVGAPPNWTVGAPGPARGLTPAILNLFVQGPNNGGSPTMQTLTGPNSFVNLANAWIASGGILHVSMAMNNPAHPRAGSSTAPDGWLHNPAIGSGADNSIKTYNPWTTGNSLLSPGTPTNLAFMANLAQIAALLKQINGPFLFVPWGRDFQHQSSG
jgi:hypothetical protein